MNNDKKGPVSRLVKAATKVEPNEIRATVLSFLFVFTLMTAYFIIRPVRDAMASDWSRADTSLLWSLTKYSASCAKGMWAISWRSLPYPSLIRIEP